MTDDPTPPPDEDDLGPPAVELQRLVEPPRPGFVSRLRARIQRREATGHWLDFAVFALGTVLRQFLDLVFSIFPGSSDRR